MEETFTNVHKVTIMRCEDKYMPQCWIVTVHLRTDTREVFRDHFESLEEVAEWLTKNVEDAPK